MRINPYELHIDDPGYYDELCAGGYKRRDKWARAVGMFGNPSSMLELGAHDLHRERRAALALNFSKRLVTALERLICLIIEQLCTRFAEFQKSGEPVNLRDAYAALIMDIITEYGFAKSYSCVAQPKFTPEWYEIVITASEACLVNKHFTWLYSLMQLMPESFVAKLDPKMIKLLELQNLWPYISHLQIIALSLVNFYHFRSCTVSFSILGGVSVFVLLLCVLVVVSRSDNNFPSSCDYCNMNGLLLTLHAV